MAKVVKKNLFITLFISTNIFFVFLLIHKQTNMSRLFYTQQTLEQELEQVRQKKQQLTQVFYSCQDKNSIKDIALNKLGMQKITLQQIKKVNNVSP